MASRPRSRWRASVVALVAVGILVRLAVVIADDGYTPAHDAFDYDRHAVAVAAGEGFPVSGYAAESGPTALRAPAYPYALGATYAALGVEADGGRILNVLLGGLTVALTALLGARIAGAHAGLIAGLIAALFPPLVLLSRDLLSENLFIPVALGVALAAVHWRGDPRARWLVLTGALCGLAALTRNPGPAVILPALVGVWWLKPRLSLRSLAAPAIVLAVGCLVVLPWTIRNAVEFGRFVPVTSSTGFALAGTYNDTSRDDPDFSTSWRAPNFVPAFEPLFEAGGVDEATLDSTLRREATEFARGHPGYVAEVAAHNAMRLFMLEGGSVVDAQGPVDTRGIGSGTTLSERIALAVLMPFVVAGAILLFSRARAAKLVGRTAPPTGFVWMIPALLLLSAALVAGLPRYRVPADPFLIILAATALAAVASSLAARRRNGEAPRVPKATAGVAAVLALSVPVAGCGSDDPDVPAGGIPKDEYIARADAICEKYLAQTRALVDEALANQNAVSGSLLDFTTEQLVRPGLKVRRNLGDALEALPPTAPDPNLTTFLDLFPATENLIEERLRAGERGDEAEAKQIDALLQRLGVEQQGAANAYGMDACAQDFSSLQ